MADDPSPVAKTPTKSAGTILTSNFYKLTGYTAQDILAVNLDRLTWVTSNGGKYRLNKKGTTVQRISGPPYPKEAAEE